MKLLWVSILFILVGLSAFAQDTTRVRRYYELKPIEKRLGFLRNDYLYEGKKIRTPYATQIPFQVLNDSQVNRHYKTFHTLNQVSGIVSLVPLAYLLVNGRNIVTDLDRFWVIWGGSLATSVICSIIASSQFDKAVVRYNVLVMKANKSGSLYHPASHIGIGLGLSCSF